jgi:hypothetical protein
MARKEKLGLTAIIVSAVCMVVRLVIGIVFAVHYFKTMPMPNNFNFPR